MRFSSMYSNCYSQLVLLLIISAITHPIVLSHEREKKQLDAFICISSEDEKYNVKGGIGTYLGILTKEVKRLYPTVKVYWITKSHNAFDFSETDTFGIERHYLSDTCPYQDRPFYRHLRLHENDQDNSLINQHVFLNKVNEKLSILLKELAGKNVAIECGEWEGIAHQVFRVIKDKNVVKATRIHTPLAVTMLSNKLDVPAVNKLQLIHECEVLEHADCISSCTQFMKDQLTQAVLGVESPKAQTIAVIPNPVDSNTYKQGVYTRKESIKRINALLQQEFLNDTTFNVYIIGSIETRKGAELVVDAIAQVAEQLPQARFCFFGHHGGNDSKNLTANTKLPPCVLYERIHQQYRHQVAFAGYVDHAQLPLIIESGDVFPIMYLGDNFPGTVAEIALMAKPILALSRGGVNEMLQNEHGEFLAYDLGSSLDTASQVLAEGLLELHANIALRNTIGKNIEALIRRKYTPEKTARDIIEFYTACLARKSEQ